MIVAGIAFGATPLQFSSTSSQPRTLPPAQLNSRRKALFSGAIGSIALIARPALSLGLESIDLPPPEMPAGIADQIANIQRRNKRESHCNSAYPKDFVDMMAIIYRWIHTSLPRRDFE